MVPPEARGYSAPVTLTDTPDLRICPLCDRRTAARTCPADGHATEVADDRTLDTLLAFGPTVDDRATIPEADHPGMAMATVLLPADRDELTVEKPPPIDPTLTDGEAVTAANPEPIPSHVDEDAPTRALLSPAVQAAHDGPPPASGPAPRSAPPSDPPPSEAVPAATRPAPIPRGRRILNIETLPPPLPTGLHLPASAATSAADLTPPRVRGAWLKWLLGLVGAIALGIGLGAILGSL